MKRHIIDDNGEVLTTINENDKIKVIREEQVNYLKDNDIDFNSKEDFVKFFTRNIDKLVKKLTMSEIGMLLALTPYISYKDCILRVSGHGNGKCLNTKDLCNLLDMNDKTFYRIFNGLKVKGVVGEHETGSLYIDTKLKKVITINPYIVCRGNKISKTIITFYDNSWKEYLNEE